MGSGKGRNVHNWTVDEICFLVENFSKHTGAEIAEMMGLTYMQVRPKIRDFCMAKDRWTAEELRILLENPDKPIDWICSKTGRSYDAVRVKRQQKGIALSNAWSKEEDEVLVKTLDKPVGEALEALKGVSAKGIVRTHNGVSARRTRLRKDKGINRYIPKKEKPKYKPKQESEALRNAYRALGI